MHPFTKEGEEDGPGIATAHKVKILYGVLALMVKIRKTFTVCIPSDTGKTR